MADRELVEAVQVRQVETHSGRDMHTDLHRTHAACTRRRTSARTHTHTHTHTHTYVYTQTQTHTTHTHTNTHTCACAHPHAHSLPTTTHTHLFRKYWCLEGVWTHMSCRGFRFSVGLLRLIICLADRWLTGLGSKSTRTRFCARLQRGCALGGTPSGNPAWKTQRLHAGNQAAHRCAGGGTSSSSPSPH